MGRGIGQWVASDAHAVVLRVLGELRRQGGERVLDIPAGGGPLAREVLAMGWRLTEADLLPRPGLRGVAADACAPFPFRDGCVDCVVSMEGIEHFEQQAGYLRECARVLRPGGHLVLTTPSLLHLSARVSTLLTGQRTLHGFVNEVSTLRGRHGQRVHHGHAFLIDIFRLRYLLRVAGLEIDRVYPTDLSLGSLLVAPLAPFVWLGSWYGLLQTRRRPRKHRRPVPPPAVRDALARLAYSPRLLFGKKLVVVARLTG